MSVFAQIIAGRLPAAFVYRDDFCVAFMDIRPLARGHVLVVPRRAVATMSELDAGLRSHLWEVVERIGRAQRSALGSSAQHLLVNDGRDAAQSVPHVHVHVIPRYRGDGLRTVLRMMLHLGGRALPRLIATPPPADLQAQAELIAAAMDGS